MSAIGTTPACDAAPVDRAALDDALALAASRCGRLSDDQVGALLRRRRRIAVAVPAVAAAIVALAIVDIRHLAAPPVRVAHRYQDFATRPGGRGTATLADGSTIRLNGATRVRVDYTATGRTARLIAGQAFFDVRHDPARPFTVHAGAGEARVLGTAFDVDLTRRQVALSVYRGAVGFDAAGSTRRVVVRAGYRSRLRAGSPDQPMRFDPSLPDWRQGWIDTTGMRLDELVDVLRRQRSVAIVPPDGALAGMTVTGRFRTDRPRELLAAIGDGFGFTVAETPAGLALRSSR